MMIRPYRDPLHNRPLAHNLIKMCHNKLERINEPHMAESYTWNEQGWDDSDSCRTSLSERPQPSHLDGQCKAPLDNVKSRCRNNAGNCKGKQKV